MTTLPLRKLIDIPPVWLVGMCLLAWLQSRYLDLNLGFGGTGSDVLSGLCIGAGLTLMLLAFIEMRKQRTTVIPHLDAQNLVTTGIFSRTRNPIYLGDAFVLTGLILRWDAVLALPLIVVFLSILERRFIIPEENRLRSKFEMEFATYCQKVRRWI